MTNSEAPKMNVGTHLSHCCKRHGCKYGNTKCPVALDELLQNNPCEFCRSKSEIEDEIAELQEELAWAKELAALRFPC